MLKQLSFVFEHQKPNLNRVVEFNKEKVWIDSDKNIKFPKDSPKIESEINFIGDNPIY